MKLGFSSLAFPEKTLEEIIEIAVENRYDGIELRGGQSNGHISTNLNMYEREKIKELFEEKRLEICCLTSYNRLGYKVEAKREESVEEIKNYIELAKDLECPYIRVFGVPENCDEKDFDFLISQIIKSFEELGSYIQYKNYSVKLLLETHDRLCRVKDLIQIFKNLTNDNCGIIWDVAHTLQAGDSLNTTLKTLHPWINHIHIKDWIKLPNGFDHYVLLGAGILPIQELIQLLNSYNYKNYLSIEWEKPWHPDIEKSEISIFQYKWKIEEYLKR